MFAFFLFDAGRSPLRLNEGMQPLGCLLRQSAESLVKENGGTPPPLPIVERSVRNRQGEYLLQAKRLSAKLDFIGLMALRFPALVFYGDDGAPVAGIFMKLDNVALAAEPEG